MDDEQLKHNFLERRAREEAEKGAPEPAIPVNERLRRVLHSEPHEALQEMLAPDTVELFGGPVTGNDIDGVPTEEIGTAPPARRWTESEIRRALLACDVDKVKINGVMRVLVAMR